MLGRTPPEAVSNYVEPIQRAVSCVSDSVVSADGGYYVSHAPHILTLNRGIPVRIGGTSGIWLSFQQYYRIVETEVPDDRWTVIEAGYEYEILDSDHSEVLAYHWHPTGLSSFASQHLHLGYGASIGREELLNAHLPSGYVSVADILRLLIRDFDATPRRPDWDSVLSASRP